MSKLLGLYGHYAQNDGYGNGSGDEKDWYQFQVIEVLGPAYVLVQLFSWLDGAPTDCTVLPISAFVGMTLYGDVEEWRAVGDRKLRVKAPR